MPSGGAVRVEYVVGERSGADVVTGVVAPHLLQRDPEGDECAEHGSGGRAHDDIEVINVNSERLEGVKGSHGPGPAEDAASSEDQSPTWHEHICLLAPILARAIRPRCAMDATIRPTLMRCTSPVTHARP